MDMSQLQAYHQESGLSLNKVLPEGLKPCSLHPKWVLWRTHLVIPTYSQKCCSLQLHKVGHISQQYNMFPIVYRQFIEPNERSHFSSITSYSCYFSKHTNGTVSFSLPEMITGITTSLKIHRIYTFIKLQTILCQRMGHSSWRPLYFFFYFFVPLYINLFFVTWAKCH